MTTLFDPFTLKGRTLRNRIAISPMCQYSAVDSLPTDWHRVHLEGLARGGAELVTVEGTAVTPEGRITPADLGLWSDEQAEALAPLAASIKRFGAVAGIQLAHAGRKASANLPWEGDDHIAAADPRGWEPVAASAIAAGGTLPRVPRALELQEIQDIRAAFVASAIRARDAGFDWLNLHFAHGYLAQNFLSLFSNTREDAYGGSLDNRRRFLLEVLSDVRAVWPEDRPLTMRFGVIDFDGRDDETLAEGIDLLRLFKDAGLDFADISIGFSSAAASPPWAPNFMAPIASKVRAETGLPVSASWFISDPVEADALVREEKLDLVMLGRPVLADPHWPYAAAVKLGVPEAAWTTLPAPYAHWLARYR